MSFVSGLFLFARVGAIWWPLCSSAWCVCPLFQCSFCLPGLGPFGGPCVALFEGCVCPLFQCSFCLPGLGPGGGPWAPWGLIFDVFEATGVTFWSILASFWEPGAPCGHLPSPSGARVTQNRKLCENWLPNGSHFGSLLATLGTLGLHKGGPWSQNGAQSDPKVGFVDFVKMSVFSL